MWKHESWILLVLLLAIIFLLGALAVVNDSDAAAFWTGAVLGYAPVVLAVWAGWRERS